MMPFIRNRLSRTILSVLAVSVALVMGTGIYLRLSSGIQDRIRMMSLFGRELAASTYAGIKHPMSIGDADAVKKQLSDIRKTMNEVEVFICDFDQVIVYASHDDKVKTNIRDSLVNTTALASFSEILKSGDTPQRAFEEEVAGKKYLVTLHPIMNGAECHHCHGSTRRVLGGMVIRMSADQPYAALAATTKRSIVISFLGIGAIIALTYAMLSRLVVRPIEGLASASRKFADGDMSVSVDVRAEDEVGQLGNSFNYMVRRISSFSRELETEVARRTMMLREKTLLLERANRELRELDRLKSSFLANMSHELRTPMNSIIGYTELLIDGIDGPVNDEQQKSLEKISNNARQLLQLINDILDMSKIEAGKIELDIKELDIRQLAESVASAFRPALTKKGLSLTMDFVEGISTIYADEEKLKQILINLISNAVKFTSQGGLTIRARPSERGITPGEPPLFLDVCVEDTGIGIKEEDIGKLFDKFSQLDISTIRQYEGTGLGLSIARGLVVLHKGVIWVSSKYGHGSRFCFTLPMKKEIMEKPEVPIIEERMAKGLAEYFSKPPEIFLKGPRYAGKEIKCWEYIHCGQTSCPAYGSTEHRCWLMLGTHCKGIKVAAYPEKVDFCKGCEIIERLILEAGPIRDEEMEEEKWREGQPEAKKTVLAIDDNPEAIEIIRKYLGEDYRVIGHSSGEGAVTKAKELHPTAITLDIMMPGKDGWQVLQELKSTPETQDIPVIVLSIVDEKKMGFSLGAAEYLVKPVEREVLLKKLLNLEKTVIIRDILVVDNDTDTVHVIVNALQTAGYRMKTAFTSRNAIRSIQDALPDLIIINLTMPGIGGFDVIEYIKTDERVRDLPLIVLTHKDLSDSEINALNGRIQGILNKGMLGREEILSGLRDILRGVR